MVFGAKWTQVAVVTMIVWAAAFLLLVGAGVVLVLIDPEQNTDVGVAGMWLALAGIMVGLGVPMLALLAPAMVYLACQCRAVAVGASASNRTSVEEDSEQAR